MITTTPKQIGEGMPGLNALLAAKLPMKAKYAVSKLARACQDELEHFQKQTKAIFEEAGCVIEGEGEKARWVHAEGDKDKLKAAEKQAEEMSTASCEINALPLDLEQFGNGDIEGPAFFGLEWAMKA